jgi:aminoglycoside phosphotransferase (APT) family kinase protein
VSSALSGFYNANVRVGEYLVRVPLPGAERMDLQIWPEPEVLAAIREHAPTAPRLRATSDDPPYQIHDWIDGQVLDAVAPRGTPVPAGVIEQCAALFGVVGQVPAADLPALPAGWPADGDCAGFAARLLAVTRGVHTKFAEQYRDLWRALEIPDDPFAPLALHDLRPRQFRLLHCDVHRKNIILRQDVTRPYGVECWFLDWELALFGDPVYEVAVHLHKMGYQPAEEAALLRAWQTAVRADQWPGWQEDLAAYRAHERVKSAVVDSVRYAQLVAAVPAQREARAANLTGKLNAARLVWGQHRPIEPELVAAALT